MSCFTFSPVPGLRHCRSGGVLCHRVTSYGKQALSRALHLPVYPKAAKTESRSSTFAPLIRSFAKTKEWTPQQQLHVREALSAESLGLGFSAGGFLYGYHLGAIWELEDLGLIKGNVLMAGASAGSLAIATYNSGISRVEAVRALKEFAAECRTGGTIFRLGGLLREFLHTYLPSNAHKLCSGCCHVALTQMYPKFQSELVSEFYNKDDLVEALVTSCHVPWYATGTLTTKFRDKYYLDGGATNFLPSPPTSQHVVKFCCFPVSNLISAVSSSLYGPGFQPPSILDISVSPDAFESFSPSYRTVLAWALAPASDQVLDYLIDKGRKDTRSWAKAVDIA